MRWIALLLVLFITSCSADKVQVARILQAEGCSDVTVGGWDLFGCDKHDTFVNTFSCTKNGIPVSGHVCSGFLKGYTIRYN